jgi:hypothetical protein
LLPQVEVKDFVFLLNKMGETEIGSNLCFNESFCVYVCGKWIRERQARKESRKQIR